MSAVNDLKDAGDGMHAHKILMELCQSDLRCLDAHAHLANFVFDHGPKEAIRHYEVGLRIGELSLGERFEGVLLWGHIDNRPFLRCMHGYGSVTDCVSGDWGASTRWSASLERCSGSTHPTTRACGSCSKTSGHGTHGKRTEKNGEA